MSGTTRKLTALEQKIHQTALAAEDQTLAMPALISLEPDAATRTAAINFLLSAGLLKPMKSSSGRLHFRGVGKKEADVKKDLTPEENMVFGHIQASGNEGIWTKHIKVKTELHQTILDRCLKSLVQKKLVKAVSGSVQHPTRKMYMLFHLEPSVEVTGGPWYTDKELDTEFIKLLSKACLKFIRDRSFPRASSSSSSTRIPPDRLLFPISQAPAYPSASQVQTFLNKSRITETQLTVEHVEMLLYVLCVDGEIERIPAIGAALWDPGTLDGGSDDDGSGSDNPGSGSDSSSRHYKIRKKSKKSPSKLSRRRESRNKHRRRDASSLEDESEDESDAGSESEGDLGGSSKKRKRGSAKKSGERSRKRRKGDESRSESEDESGSEEGRRKRRRGNGRTKDKSSKTKRRRRDKSTSGSETEGSDSDDDDEDDKKRRKKSSKSKASSCRSKSSKSRKRKASPSLSSEHGSDENPDDSDSDSRPPSKRRSSKSVSKSKYQSKSSSSRIPKMDVDLASTTHVYRAIHPERLSLSFGWSQAPCLRCPTFDFCAPQTKGPVNPKECVYYGEWLGRKEVEDM